MKRKNNLSYECPSENVGASTKAVSTANKLALKMLGNYCNPYWKLSYNLHCQCIGKIIQFPGHFEVKDTTDIYYSQLPHGNCIAKRKPYKR